MTLFYPCFLLLSSSSLHAAPGSTDSGGPESSMKTSPPRSPRMVGHQGTSHGMMSHVAMTVGQQKQQQAAVAAAVAAGHQPISSLAASHQAITSLLSRPQSKQGKNTLRVLNFNSLLKQSFSVSVLITDIFFFTHQFYY